MKELTNSSSQTTVRLSRAEAYAQALQKLLGRRLAAVALFGSTARAQARHGSDIDLIVVAEGLPQGNRARQEVLAPARAEVEPARLALEEQGVHTDFTTIIMTPEEAARFRYLYLDLTQDAILLYDRDGFFAGVLERLRRRLAELGAKRVWTGKTWYWVLKPDFQPGEEFTLDGVHGLHAISKSSGKTATIIGEKAEVASMTVLDNKEAARAMFSTAKAIAEEAKWLYSRGRWHLVVRRCQEAVELALKASLRWGGIEVPKEYDPGYVLRRNIASFPSDFTEGHCLCVVAGSRMDRRDS
jgi:hypothetical protein